MLEILAVCTGNICRSPLAAVVLSERMADLDVSVSSAGTRARDGMQMTPEAIALGRARGVSVQSLERHRARLFSDHRMYKADLVLAMDRGHRRRIVEIDPSLTRRTFTIREIARLADGLTEDDLETGVVEGGGAGHSDGHALGSVLSFVASRRGLVLPAASPEEDDVIDPYGRSQLVYETSAAQLEPGLEAVERLVRFALTLHR